MRGKKIAKTLLLPSVRRLQFLSSATGVQTGQAHAVFHGSFSSQHYSSRQGLPQREETNTAVRKRDKPRVPQYPQGRTAAAVRRTAGRYHDFEQHPSTPRAFEVLHNPHPEPSTLTKNDSTRSKRPPNVCAQTAFSSTTFLLSAGESHPERVLVLGVVQRRRECEGHRQGRERSALQLVPTTGAKHTVPHGTTGGGGRDGRWLKERKTLRDRILDL